MDTKWTRGAVTLIRSRDLLSRRALIRVSKTNLVFIVHRRMSEIAVVSGAEKILCRRKWTSSYGVGVRFIGGNEHRETDVWLTTLRTQRNRPAMIYDTREFRPACFHVQRSSPGWSAILVPRIPTAETETIRRFISSCMLWPGILYNYIITYNIGCNWETNPLE